LPMGTDAAVAVSVAKAAASLSEEIVVAPTIHYGVSRHHDRLPGGAVSLPPRVLIEVLISVVSDLLRTGTSRSVIVLNGHGGNWASITCALDELGGTRGELPVAACSWWHLVPDLIEPHDVPGKERVGHAGAIETSAMLALMPDLVALELAPDTMSPDAGAITSAYIWRDFARLDPSGVIGTPRRATASFGHELVQTAAARLVQLAAALREAGPPRATR
jgi:creatinine amidohydrolase